MVTQAESRVDYMFCFLDIITNFLNILTVLILFFEMEQIVQ